MWPPEFPEFFLRDSDMPLLYATSPLTRGATDRQTDLELGTANQLNAATGRADRGAENKSGVENDSGAQAHETMPNDQVHDASMSLPKFFSTAGTSTNLAQQIKKFQSSEDHPCSCAGVASFASSTVTLMDHHGIVAATGLPPKRFDRFMRNMRYTFFSVYRRLYTLVLLPNIIVMIVIGALNRPGLLQTPVTMLATAATANILLTVLMRQELGKSCPLSLKQSPLTTLVINALFVLFGHCPQWFPLRIRRLSAKIYHLGGVHSGAGVAATVWFGVTNLRVFSGGTIDTSLRMRAALWTITITIDMFLFLIIFLSIPNIRRTRHDWWEWSQ